MSAKFFKQTNVNVQHNEEAQEFIIEARPDNVVLTYEQEENTWRLTGVQIPQELRKLHVGPAIMEYALEKARREKVQVQPECAYASNYIARHPRFKKLLPKDEA
ncbi:MAG: N-acetyltransferase [Bacteroidota bacterium]